MVSAIAPTANPFPGLPALTSAGRRLEIPLVRVHPLTIVAAIDCDDHLLIAADSDVINDDTSLRGQVRKLDSLAQRPIAWGYAGMVEAADDFATWLHQLEWADVHTWHQFRDLATDEVTRLNRQRRRWIRQSGANPTKEDWLDILVAGYVDGKPEILRIEGKGSPAFTLTDHFAAIGSGRPHAEIAMFTARIIVGQQRFTYGPNWLGVAMTVAVNKAPHCGPPLRGLKISPSGVEDFRP